jgi:hypothetical protein
MLDAQTVETILQALDDVSGQLDINPQVRVQGLPDIESLEYIKFVMA